MLAEAILVHGVIGYKFYWLLPSEDQNQGTPVDWAPINRTYTSWARIKWRRCRGPLRGHESAETTIGNESIINANQKQRLKKQKKTTTTVAVAAAATDKEESGSQWIEGEKWKQRNEILQEADEDRIQTDSPAKRKCKSQSHLG